MLDAEGALYHVPETEEVCAEAHAEVLVAAGPI